jgi:hypothetical protein
MKNSMAAASDSARSGHANSLRTENAGKSAMADGVITFPVLWRARSPAEMQNHLSQRAMSRPYHSQLL